MARLAPAIPLLLALSACGGSSPAAPGPDPLPEPEVVRPEWRLLVERVSPGGTRSFVAATPDHAFVEPLAWIPADTLRVEPAPDGRTLALVRAVEGTVQVWLAGRHGSSRLLLDGLTAVDGLCWSPDGRRLAVSVSTPDDLADVWVVNADGTGTVNLTPDPKPAVFQDRDPAWSPDGARIAFTSNRSGTTRLWLMEADGSSPRRVFPDTVVASERQPAWSPDGTRLAFLSASETGAGVAVSRVDGSGLQVFTSPFAAASPTWLPDGRVAFSDRRTGDLEIHALDPATGVLANLTGHRDHDLRATVLRRADPPAWQGFEAPVRHPLPAGPGTALAVGDLDADGRADVTVLTPALPGIRLLRGTGGGGLALLGSLESTAGALDLAAGRVSLDAATDLVALEGDALALYRGGPVGPGVAERIGLAGEARGMAVVDLGRSGRDVVAVVVERPGSGFHLGVYAAGGDDVLLWNLDLATDFQGAGRTCSGDFTGEGFADLVVVTGSAAAPLVLLPGHGDVTFDAPRAAGADLVADRLALPVCADLDGDGRADLAVLRPGVAAGLSLLPARGSAFGPAVALPLAALDVAAADLDRDGDVDLVLVPASGTGLLFLRNLGDGRFAAAVSLAPGLAAARLRAADLDGDGWPDLLVMESGGGVAVLRNRGG